MGQADETTTYNGWKNYETWAVNLWMSNDQGADEMFREMADQAWAEADSAERPDYFTRSQQARIQLADMLKDSHEDVMPDLDGVWSDLLRAAFSEVDWYEIADGLLSDQDGYESR